MASPIPLGGLGPGPVEDRKPQNKIEVPNDSVEKSASLACSKTISLASECHVLLVDDERLSRTVISSLLRRCNYTGRIFAYFFFLAMHRLRRKKQSGDVDIVQNCKPYTLSGSRT